VFRAGMAPCYSGLIGTKWAESRHCGDGGWQDVDSVEGEGGCALFGIDY
jgi:hypothetical protein